MRKIISDRTKRINLFNTAHACIEYVGHANYPERETAASEALEKSYETGECINPEEMKTK
jgi:hypothetical protein